MSDGRRAVLAALLSIGMPALVIALAEIERAPVGERTAFAPPCAVVEDADDRVFFDEAVWNHAAAPVQELRAAMTARKQA